MKRTAQTKVANKSNLDSFPVIEGRPAGPVNNGRNLNGVHATDSLFFSENAVCHATVVEKVSGKRTVGEVGAAAAVDSANDMEVSLSQFDEPRGGKARTIHLQYIGGNDVKVIVPLIF